MAEWREHSCSSDPAQTTRGRCLLPALHPCLPPTFLSAGGRESHLFLLVQPCVWAGAKEKTMQEAPSIAQCPLTTVALRWHISAHFTENHRKSIWNNYVSLEWILNQGQWRSVHKCLALTRHLLARDWPVPSGVGTSQHQAGYYRGNGLRVPKLVSLLFGAWSV